MQQGNLSYLNAGGMQARKHTALAINCAASLGLQEVLKSNLGPRGTMKMLVSGAGLVKITKDGNTLLGEMQIQHPTATLIARAATATDDVTGDGTTSTVLCIGEMMRQAQRHILEGVHPRQLTEGFSIAKEEALKWIATGTPIIPVGTDSSELKDVLTQVARTALSTKIGSAEKETLAKACCEAVLAVRGGQEDKEAEVDLHMVEVMHMKSKQSTDTRFVNGIVLDHGARHDDMPKHLENCYILIANVSLEYERSELGAGFHYSSPEQKMRMAAAERKVTDDKVRDIIALKNKVCTKENGKSFVVINQKGIDGVALEMLAREGITALRRAKRRNMERLALACGGEAINSTEELEPSVLGYAGLVYEQALGDDKFTFVEQVQKGNSCTIFLRGSNDHTIAQLKDAVRDGLRAVKNVLDDKGVVPGAGYFEVALAAYLNKISEDTSIVKGKQKLGVKAYAEGLLIVPKALAENSGHDVAASLIAVQEAMQKDKAAGGKGFFGLSIESGDAIDPVAAGIYDNVCVKKTLVDTAGVISSQLLLVDEIMKAGRRGHN